MRLKVGFKAPECTASNGSQGEAEERSLATSPSHQGRRGREPSYSVSKKNRAVEAARVSLPSGHSFPSLCPPRFTHPGNVKGLGNVQTTSRSPNALLIKQQADIRASQPCLGKCAEQKEPGRTTRNIQRK